MTSYTWKRADEWTVKRPVYGYEALLCAASSTVKSFTSPLAALTIQTELPVEVFKTDLQTAWKGLRFQAPGIATKIGLVGESYEFTYTVPKNEEEAQDWALATLLERPSVATSKDLVSTLVNDAEQRDKYCPDNGDYAARVYFASGQLQGEYHLCFFAQHAALDLRGPLLAFDLLLDHLAHPKMVEEWGEEIDRLPLAISYETKLRKDGDTPPDGLQGIMQAMKASQSDAAPLCTLPNRSAKAISTEVITQYAQLELSQQQTEGIKKAAEAHNTKFSYVIGVAVALAILKNSTNRDTAKSVILPAVPIDIRHRLPEAKQRHYIALALVLADSVAIPVSLLTEINSVADSKGTLSTLYWQAVEMINDQWEKIKASELHIALENEITGGLVGVLRKAGPEAVFIPTCFYSPVGVVESFLAASHDAKNRNIKVTQPFLTGYGANGLSIALHTWTWNGKFKALANYSTEFYSTDLVEGLMSDIQFYLKLVAAA